MLPGIWGSVQQRSPSPGLRQRVVDDMCMRKFNVSGLAHGINAIVVHRWRQLLREGKLSVAAISSGFAPVSLALTPAAGSSVARADIDVELRRGAIAMAINWLASRRLHSGKFIWLHTFM